MKLKRTSKKTIGLIWVAWLQGQTPNQIGKDVSCSARTVYNHVNKFKAWIAGDQVPTWLQALANKHKITPQQWAARAVNSAHDVREADHPSDLPTKADDAPPPILQRLERQLAEIRKRGDVQIRHEKITAHLVASAVRVMVGRLEGYVDHQCIYCAQVNRVAVPGQYRIQLREINNLIRLEREVHRLNDVTGYTTELPRSRSEQLADALEAVEAARIIAARIVDITGGDPVEVAIASLVRAERGSV